MEGIIIAVTGAVATLSSGYAIRAEIIKRKLDSSDKARATKIDEFGQLLQGYKDLKQEYEDQVKQFREENNILRTEIKSLRQTMTKYEKRIKELEAIQKTIKKEIA